MRILESSIFVLVFQVLLVFCVKSRSPSPINESISPQRQIRYKRRTQANYEDKPVKIASSKTVSTYDLLNILHYAEDQTGWSGSQLTLPMFERYSEKAKSRLRTFELHRANRLKISQLLNCLNSTEQLESIQLNSVQLTFDIPITINELLVLPKLKEFNIILKPIRDTEVTYDRHEPYAVPLNQTLFFTRAKDEGQNITKLLGQRINFNYTYGCFTIFSLLHSGSGAELVLGGRTNSEIQTMVLDYIKKSEFLIEKFTCNNCICNNDYLISPSSLTHLDVLKISPHSFNFSDLLNGSYPSLKEIKIVYVTRYPEYRFLKLDKFSIGIEKAAFVNFVITTDDQFPVLINMKQIMFSHCHVAENIINNICNIFPNMTHFGISSSSLNCHPLIYKLMNECNNLQGIYLGECNVDCNFWSLYPHLYNQTQHLFNEFGCSHKMRHVVFQNVDGIWIRKPSNFSWIPEIEFLYDSLRYIPY